MTDRTDLAAALLKDVPRWGLVRLSEPVLMESPAGDVVRYADVLAALSRALDPAIAERAGEVIRWLVEADDRGDGDLAMVHCAPAADLITALLTANAALRAERDEALEWLSASQGYIADAVFALDKQEKAEAERDALRAERDALAAEVKQADTMLVAEANASLERLARAEAAEAEAEKLRGALEWIEALDDHAECCGKEYTECCGQPEYGLDRAKRVARNARAALAPTDAPDLSDPVTVHANMLRGSIAKPTVEQIVHLYGREAFQPMIDVAIAKALEKACLAVSEHADWPEDEHGRTEQGGLFARVINAIRGITPALSPALAPTDAAQVDHEGLLDWLGSFPPPNDKLRQTYADYQKAISDGRLKVAPTNAAQAREAALRADEMLRVAARYIRDHYPDGLIRYDDADCDGACVADDCEAAADALIGEART